MAEKTRGHGQGGHRPAAAIAFALSLGLVACGGGGGGGGGGVRSNPPPNAPPPDPPPSSGQPTIDGHLGLTNSFAAHEEGFNGTGTIIGVIDTGVNRNHPALVGRVIANLNYVDPASNDLGVDDVVGHGTAVTQLIAGKPFGEWPGGIAPGAQIVSARVINDEPPEDDGSGQGNEVPAGDDTPLFFGQLNDDLVDAGVRVTNNSWGGLYWNDASVTAAFVQAYSPFVLQHEGLVVFATGNESRANPSDNAALPSKSTAAHALEKGWLAVAALNSLDSTHLADYSNACGVAMHYCLAAPGDVIVTGTDDKAGNPSYWIWQGTSLAAPLVTGTTALVWQAFPYFDNDLVRQTILGTATDLGAAGVDPVFGYGALDVTKAVHGPAKFDWGDVHVSFDGITSTWSNDIDGAGGLVKEGTGKLILTGWNSFHGATQVLGGTLRIDAQFASPLSIGPAGTVVIGIQTNGDVLNHGTLSVGDTNNGFTITGNYHQAADGRLALDIGDHVEVDGDIQIDGGALHVLGINDGYVAKSRETVLTTAGFGTFAGQFDALTAAPGVMLDATLGYDSISAWLDITRVEVSAIQGLNYTAASTASAARVELAMKAIDRQIAHAGPGAIGGGFIAAAGDFQRAPTMAIAEASLESLSGELHATADAMTYESIDAGRRALSSRFDELAAQPRLVGAWQRNLDESGGMTRSGFAGFDYAISGNILGQDMRIGEGGVFGFAASRSSGNGWLDGRNDRSRSRQDEAQLYGGVIGDNAYLQGRLGSGRFERKVDRQILLGTHASGAATGYSGAYDVAHIESGLRFRFGQSRLAPYLASQLARIRNDGFDESGADGFGLKVRASRSERWQAIAGLRANRDWTLANGGWIGLDARAEWQRTLASSGGVFDASFVGVEQWQSLAGIGLADRSRLLGIGLDLGLSEHGRLHFDVSRRVAPNLQDNQLGMQYAYGF